MFATLDKPAAPRTPAASIRSAAPFLSIIENLTDRTHRNLSPELPEGREALATLLERAMATSPLGFRRLNYLQLLRRLHRRMRAAGESDLTAYCAMAEAHPEELSQLRRNLHVRSTRFFSDPESLFVLERYALLGLFAAGSLKGGIRILVTGSGSGEEAYSVALLLHEYARCMEQPPAIEIHAVENDETQVDVARRGRYPRALADDLSDACLAGYFTEDADGFTLLPHVRESVVFHHGVPAEDVAFDELDLIVSRNPVLLMDPVRQDELLRSCHARLRTGGYLLLGAPMSAEESSAYFDNVVASSGLYRSRELDADVPAPLTEASLTEAHQKMRTRGLLAYARYLKEELFQSEERARMTQEYLEGSHDVMADDTDALREAYAQLEQVIAASNTGLLHLDSHLRVRLYSHGLPGILDLEAGDIGRPLTDFSWPVRHTLQEMASDALRTHLPAERAVSLRERTYQIQVNPLDDPAAGAMGVVCSFIDTTTFTRSDEWVDLQRQAFDQLHDPVIVTNRALQVLFANDAASQRYGIDRQRAAGRNLSDLLQIDWPTPVERQQAHDALVETGSWVGRQVHRTLTGGAYDVETAVSMLRDAKGEEIGMMIAVRDLTYRNPLGIEALRQMISDLDARNASQSKDGAPAEATPLPELRPNRPPRERSLFR
ncbi:MAG: CheR family methyltransferase [Rhodothermales bacterium]